MTAQRETILSGMRPTGKLHLGNYFGALQNWIQLQNQYKCYYMVADWHALTSDYEDTSALESNVYDMVIDWLAAGLDPKVCVIFRQSWIPEHTELHLLLSMITPLSWLERVPTYKDQIQQMQNKDLSTYGFLGYPLLQSADILLYKASRVPVGEDQLPHLEFTREIARRFNFICKKEVFVEPQSMLSRAPRVPGTDNRKMSKSYNNAVYLSDSKEDVAAKVKKMFTDPKKIRATDKGNPEGCVVFATHKLYTPEVPEIEERCKAGTLTCTACKARLTETLNEGLEPFRQSRAEWLRKPNAVNEVLNAGSQEAGKLAKETMTTIREAIHMKTSPKIGS